MIHHDWDLFPEVCNAIDQSYKKQIRRLSLNLLGLFDIFVKESSSKSFSMILFVSLPIIISMLALLECIVRVSLVSLEDKKINCYC